MTASRPSLAIFDLFDERTRQAAQDLGDVAVATRLDEEEQVLVTVAAHHRNPAHQPAALRVLGERYRKGQVLPGRVWESERGILLVDVDDPALASIAPPDSQAYLREVGVRSMIIVPFWRSGRVVGTLGVARDPGGTPYDENDFERLRQLADL